MIKAIDPNHLVSVGVIGGGQCGATGGEYVSLHSVDAVDLCEIHDYAGPVLFAGDEYNGVALRIRQCAALGKPVVIGEAGIRGTDISATDPLGARSAAFAAKMDAATMLAWPAISSGNGSTRSRRVHSRRRGCGAG